MNEPFILSKRLNISIFQCLFVFKSCLSLAVLFLCVQTVFGQQPLAFGQGYLDSLYRGVSVCGDLHAFRSEMQSKYALHKQGLGGMKDHEDWDPSAVFQCGSFTIYYEDIDNPNFQGEGFDHPIHGAARRNTLCDVLNYVESVIQIHPNANLSIYVDGSYSQANPDLDDTGYLAVAAPYYPLSPGNHFGIDDGIYSGHLFNHITTGVDPDLNVDYDASLKVNFDPASFDYTESAVYFTSSEDLSDPSNNVMKYDLFTVMLHEVTHMLGVLSALMEDPVSYNIISASPANSFTSFDWLFGYFGDITNPSSFLGNKIVIGTAVNPAVNQSVNLADDFPMRSSKIWLKNEGAPSNHNKFAGIPNFPPVSGFNNALAPSFMSHLGNGYNNFFNQHFSPGKYFSYVMSPTIQWQSIKRSWTLPEIRLLVELGYSLVPSFLASTNISPPNLNQTVIENSPPYRNDYGDIDHRLVRSDISSTLFAELRPADFSMVNSNTETNSALSNLVINIDNDATLSDMEGDEITVLPEMVFGIRGVSDGGHNHNRVVLDASGTSFTFTPAPGFYGRAEFGFYLWDGKEIGALEVYIIEVFRDESIEYDDDQELIINGDFEDGMEIRTWEATDKIYTPHERINLEPILYSGWIGAGAGHPFSFGTLSRVYHSLDNFPNFTSSGVDGGFGGYGSWEASWPYNNVPSWAPHANISTQSNMRYAAPGNLVNSLVTNLLPDEDYVLKFDLGCISSWFTIGESLNNLEIHVIEEPSNLNFISIQEIEHDIEVDVIIQDLNPIEWQSVEIPFKYCGNSTANYILFDTDVEYCYVDNISVKKDLTLPEFSVDAGPDLYLLGGCDEQPLQATIINPGCEMIFSWTPTSGLDAPNVLNPIASPIQTTTYTLFVTSLLSGAVVSDDMTVYVVDDVENLGPITLCIGDDPYDLYQNVNIPGGQFGLTIAGSGVLIDPIFNPANYSIGTYQAFYAYTSGSCEDVTYFEIIIEGFSTGTATHPNGLTVQNGSADDGAVLTGSFQFLDNLVIEDDAVFTFSNADVQFVEGKGIHVMPGGKLFILNNSHISNLACEDHWLGIHVNGVYNITEYGSFAEFHGQCTIKNSTIENARTGVANFGSPYSYTSHGGLITCEYATFKNCEVSVDLDQHFNTHPSLGIVYPIKCKFYNSTFLWDDDFQFISSIGNPMMKLRNVYKVTISGCELKNTNADIFSYPNNSVYKAAIYASKASINMTKGCNGSPPYAIDPSGNCLTGNVASKVEGFNYGIVLYVGSESVLSETSFKCYRGLWAYASKSMRISQNTFTDLPPAMLGMGSATSPFNPTWPVPYGVYLDYSTLFWFEGNTFNYPGTTQEVGLFIKGSGAPYHQIYDNNFWNTYFGVVAYDDNRGLDGTSGLKIECNDFTNESFGVMSWSTISNPPPGWGISHFQGMPQTPQTQAFPAGNYFTNTALFDAYNTMEWVNYYTHPAENVTNAININLILLPDENGCPSSFSSGLFEKELMAAGHKASADSVADVLALIVDDGDTEALTEEVVLAQYGEAVELYYDLMQVSPNLSEEVMIEAINKEYELPAALLTLILNSNPHAAKSGMVQKELDERMQPLDEYQRAMIDEGLDLVSYKEELEARQSHHEGRYNSLLNQIIIETLADTTIGEKIAAVESKIAGYETVDHYYLIIDLYLQRGDVANAQNKLDAIATDFNLDPRRDAEYADFIDVYSIIFAKESSGDSTLTTSEFNLLETIAYRHSTLAAGLALTTLNYYGDYDFLEVLVEPDLQGKSNRAKRNKVKQPEIKRCRVYPNPTSGILIVEIPDEFKDVNAMLIDMQGRVVYQESKLNGLATLNFRKESSGAYQLQLKTDDGKLNEIHRIQIAK